MFNAYVYNGAALASSSRNPNQFATALVYIRVTVSQAVSTVLRFVAGTIGSTVSATAATASVSYPTGAASSAVQVSGAPTAKRAATVTQQVSVTCTATAFKQVASAGTAAMTVSVSGAGQRLSNQAAPIDRRMAVPSETRTMVVPA
jgi:hypothetical protein